MSDYGELAKYLRVHADTLEASDADTPELIRVLARLVEGKPIAKAFGAPGDWGYGTRIGDALHRAYCPGDFEGEAGNDGKNGRDAVPPPDETPGFYHGL